MCIKIVKSCTHLLSSSDMVSDEPCEATEVPASELRIEWESSGTVSVTNLLYVFYMSSFIVVVLYCESYANMYKIYSLFPNCFDPNKPMRCVQFV